MSHQLYLKPTAAMSPAYTVSLLGRLLACIWWYVVRYVRVYLYVQYVRNLIEEHLGATRKECQTTYEISVMILKARAINGFVRRYLFFICIPLIPLIVGISSGLDVSIIYQASLNALVLGRLNHNKYWEELNIDSCLRIPKPILR